MSSLRIQHKKRTEDAIRNAAVNLAFENGLENVTTEMISAAAGVSQRTFFNYFPYKDAVYVPPRPSFDPEQVEHFVTGKGDFIDEISEFFRSVLSEIGADREIIMRSHVICQSDPKLLLLRYSTFQEIEEDIGEIIARRLGNTSDPTTPQHMAALIIATIRIGFGAWVEGAQGSAYDVVAQRLAAMRCIFDAVPETTKAGALA
ncbi:MAG: TetR family transcriptional regulator [Rhodobacteraceae bacterium]|nr:TetR family transcriptional regulator [Paracoccaceae bacterium]